MKQVKHTKFKNASILFELLTRQVTADILANIEESKALKLIKKYFNTKTELGKENQLYQALINQKFVNENKANHFIDAVVSSHQKLNKSELRNMKYNLIKEIRESYSGDNFFKANINDYKLLASIFKLFRFSSLNEDVSPIEVVEARYVVLENILNKTVVNKANDTEFDSLMENYKNQDKDVRILAYQMLVKKFNEKYKTLLDENQTKLIKLYFNDKCQDVTLSDFIKTEINRLSPIFKKKINSVGNDIIKIKLTEAYNQLQTLQTIKFIKEAHVASLLKFYELMKELNKQG
jgi:hypothetical protein